MAAREPFVPTTITIDPAVRQRLKTFGTHGMTYNEILTRMMNDIEMERFVAEIRRELMETPEAELIDLEDLDEDFLPRQPHAKSGRRAAKRPARTKTRAS